MYIDNFVNVGFFVIMDELCLGDMFVFDIGDCYNVYGGIMVGNGMIVYYLFGCMLCFEFVWFWVKKVNVWVCQIGKLFDDVVFWLVEDVWNFICRDSK